MTTYNEDLGRARIERDEARAELAKSKAFKEYVHKRLDDAGVPPNPEPEANAKTGCRIEGRLNYLINWTDGASKLLFELHPDKVEQYLKSLSWGPRTSGDERGIAASNVRGFAAHLARMLEPKT